MAKTKRKISIIDSGFSSRADSQGSRLINKDGSFNVRKSGLRFFESFSFYTWLIKMPWWRFLIVLFIGYVLINTFFASFYFAAGIEGLSGDHDLHASGQFLEAFYFSSQTLTTVGYGYYSPVGEFHTIVASFESFIGLLSFAMATGLLYGKFSRPKARFVFSSNAIVAPYREKKRALMLRVANAKSNELINANAKLMISWIDPRNKKRRQFYFLKLEIESINMMATSWTIVHPIDDESPIREMSYEKLCDLDAELILQLEAFDETYSQQIHSRTSYKHGEMVWGAKFVPILGHDGRNATLDLDDLGTYEKVELPDLEAE